MGSDKILDNYDKKNEYHYRVPFPGKTKIVSNNFSSNSFYKDDFNEKELNLSWEFQRAPVQKWYSLSEKRGSLAMYLLPQTCSGKDNPAFPGHRQQHIKKYANTLLTFSPFAENEKAGMLVFQNENHFYFLCKSIGDGNPVAQLYKSTDDTTSPVALLQSQKLAANESNEVNLKIEAKGNTYSFYYSLNNHKWGLLKNNVDEKLLSTKVAGGFVGCMYAFYATSSGAQNDNKVYFTGLNAKGMTLFSLIYFITQPFFFYNSLSNRKDINDKTG